MVEEKALAKAVTRSTFQLAMFWSNADADWNAPSKFATLAVFQLARFALKTDAPLKMPAMFETDTTFHLLMSVLNVALLLNSEAMLLTAAVFHSAMSPYVVASPPIHAVTAAPTLAFVMHKAHVTEPTVHARLNDGHALLKVTPHAL